jgi:hypothetical protein
VDVVERLMRCPLIHARSHRISPMGESRTAHDNL